MARAREGVMVGGHRSRVNRGGRVEFDRLVISLKDARANCMDLDNVTFPALVVAEDGWVQHLGSKEDLSVWRYSAISKYRKRRVMLYDCQDCAWQIDSIAPRSPGNKVTELVAGFCNWKVPVRITVRPIAEAPFQAARNALVIAIDADDDVLTQFTEAADLKNAVERAQSYESLIGALKDKRAI
jgi:hypothetical protein